MISFIVPVYNEAEGIAHFIESLSAKAKSLASTTEIIVIDDGSTDQTRSSLQKLVKPYGIKIVGFSRNFGKEHAITAGLHYCRGDAAIIIDADFQHPFELIDSFLKEWQKGYQMVYGIRRGRENESFL